MPNCGEEWASMIEVAVITNRLTAQEWSIGEEFDM